MKIALTLALMSLVVLAADNWRVRRELSEARKDAERVYALDTKQRHIIDESMTSMLECRDALDEITLRGQVGVANLMLEDVEEMRRRWSAYQKKMKRNKKPVTLLQVANSGPGVTGN